MKFVTTSLIWLLTKLLTFAAVWFLSGRTGVKVPAKAEPGQEQQHLAASFSSVLKANRRHGPGSSFKPIPFQR